MTTERTFALRRPWTLAFVNLVLALWLSSSPLLTQANPDLPGRWLPGIDVSHFSGSIDWTQVQNQGIVFAFVKATEGIDSQDPSFHRHWSQLAETELVRGAYHFYVTEDDPDLQAQFFIDTVQLGPGDLAPVVDIETLGHLTPPGLAERLRRFLTLIENHYGITPILYTSPRFWEKHLDDRFGRFPLWLAEYGVDQPQVPAGWSRWTLWQYRENASIEGIEKGADLNHLRGPITALQLP